MLVLHLLRLRAAAPVGVAVAVAPAQPQVESEFRASRLRSPFLLAPRRANPELLFCLYKRRLLSRNDSCDSV